MKKLTKSLSLSSENNIHYHIPQRWSSLFQNYHSHFIVQKKNYSSTSLTFSQITPHIFPLSKSTTCVSRNERPLPPIDSCRSRSRGTSRESWKLLHPCTNIHARVTSLSPRVVRFFHQPTKPPSLRVPSKMINFSTRRRWRWPPGWATFENGFPITRCRVAEIELSCGVNVGSFTLDGARDGPEWEIIDCNWILRGVRRVQKSVKNGLF